MAQETLKPAKTESQTDNPDIETDAEELYEDGDYASLSEEGEKESISRDARRKIEIYWEKKRLRELIDDFDESEFGF